MDTDSDSEYHVKFGSKVRPIPEEDEVWMRFIIFLLVGVHFCIISALVIRFIWRSCIYEEQDQWQNFLSESQIRNRRRETPPPNFQAALKYPLPPSVSIIEIPPPSYAEACAKLNAQSVKIESPNPESASLQNVEIHL